MCLFSLQNKDRSYRQKFLPAFPNISPIDRRAMSQCLQSSNPNPIFALRSLFSNDFFLFSLCVSVTIYEVIHRNIVLDVLMMGFVARICSHSDISLLTGGTRTNGRGVEKSVVLVIRAVIRQGQRQAIFFR